MKKLLLILGLSGLLSQSMFAASATLTIGANVMTNFSLLSLSVPVKVTSVQVNTQSTNAAVVYFIDTFTNQTLYTNAAYTNIISYATNYINTWTNYYGVTNSVTNKALIDVTNSVIATTNLWPVRYSASVGTNTTVLTDQLNAQFFTGLWITNQSAGSVNVTVTFQQ